MEEKFVLIWSFDDDYDISIKEVCVKYEITELGFIKIGTFSTNRFFIVSSKEQLEEEIYDLASRFFEDWDSEIRYDGYMFNNHNSIEAIIKSKD